MSSARPTPRRFNELVYAAETEYMKAPGESLEAGEAWLPATERF